MTSNPWCGREGTSKTCACERCEFCGGASRPANSARILREGGVTWHPPPPCKGAGATSCAPRAPAVTRRIYNLVTAREPRDLREVLILTFSDPSQPPESSNIIRAG